MTKLLEHEPAALSVELVNPVMQRGRIFFARKVGCVIISIAMHNYIHCIVVEDATTRTIDFPRVTLPVEKHCIMRHYGH